MKKFLAFFAFITFFVLLSFRSQYINAAGPARYAVCDLCGFCISPTPDGDTSGAPPPHNAPPSNWEACRSCLYPNASNDATSFDTLKIDDTNNAAPTPAKARYYTMIGCLSANTEDFTRDGAAGQIIQPILWTIFGMSGGVAFLYLMYGAFLVLTSEGQPERLNQGKNTIWGATIGLLFVLGSVFLVNLIGSGILKIPGFG